MVIASRFRNLPDEQMKHVVQYLDAGKPVVGLRTATHAFNIPDGATYAKYGWKYAGKDYEKGFGKQVLGETWVAHHGKHKFESTRGLIAPDAKDHPIARGIKDGDVWGPSDVYTVTLPLPGDSQPLVLGEVLTGMNHDDRPVSGPQNDPKMPIAWVKTYDAGAGKPGRAFTSTIAGGQDFECEAVRRLFVNACYWALGLEDEIPAQQFKPWIKPLVYLGYDESERVLRLGVPNHFKLNWVKSQFESRIEAIARASIDEQLSVRFEIHRAAELYRCGRVLVPHDQQFPARHDRAHQLGLQGERTIQQLLGATQALRVGIKVPKGLSLRARQSGERIGEVRVKRQRLVEIGSGCFEHLAEIPAFHQGLALQVGVISRDAVGRPLRQCGCHSIGQVHAERLENIPRSPTVRRRR